MKAIRLRLNAAMRHEQEAYLHIFAYERSPGRTGHANVQTTAKYDRRGEEAKRKAAGLLDIG